MISIGRETTWKELIEEFASTFREWHYLVNGFASGLILGFLLAVYLALKVVEANRDNSQD